MDESNNNGEAEKKKVEDPAPDWELLSMSMTASVSDLKSALAAAEGEGGGGGGETGSLSEATMHSQYFGQVMASVLPPAPAGEIFPQQAEQPGKQSDPEETKVDHPPVDVVGESEAQLQRDIEQQLLAAALGEEGCNSPEVASAVGLASPAKTSTPEAMEVKEVEGVVKAEVVAATVVSSSRKSKVRSGEWMKRRLQVITKKVNKSSAVWSIALVAAVTGLLIIGKRWYYDSLKSLDLSLDSFNADDKLSEIAQEIAEGNHAADSAAAAAAAPDGVESQASSGGLFGSLRDFW